MRGAGGQLDDFGEGFVFFAGSGTEQMKLDREAMARGLIGVGLRAANDPQNRPGRIEMRGRGRKKPLLELRHQPLLLLRFLDFREMIQIGVGQQFRRQRTVRAQKEKGQLFQAGFAEGTHQARPPIFAGKIFARERKFLEIILEQKPRALGIRAIRELGEDFRALGDVGLGIGEFAAEVGEGAVSFGEDGVMRVVLRGTGRTRGVSVS